MWHSLDTHIFVVERMFYDHRRFTLRYCVCACPCCSLVLRLVHIPVNQVVVYSSLRDL